MARTEIGDQIGGQEIVQSSEQRKARIRMGQMAARSEALEKRVEELERRLEEVTEVSLLQGRKIQELEARPRPPGRPRKVE